MRRHRRWNVDSVTIGRFAGDESYNERTISVGRAAGVVDQSQYAIAIGDEAGRSKQGTGAIAVGTKSGFDGQGEYAIAIGANAGVTNQYEHSIIISTNKEEIKAVKKGLYIDPIRKFDDREGRPATVKEGNILSYNYKNGTPDETKEVVTGFPRLPGYPTDAEVASAISLTAEDAGTMYFDTTKKKIKVYNGTKWVALADEEDLEKLKALLAAAANGAGRAGSSSSGNRTPGVYVASSDDGPFVAGPSIGLAQIMITDPVTGEQRRAVDGADFYWDRGGGTDAQPIFYSDLEVVSVTRPDPNRPGYVSTNYSNGHSRLEQVPLEEWNPPLAALGQLPTEERRALTKEYMDQRGYEFMLGGDSGNVDAPNTFESDAFRAFLESKGVGGG